MHYLSLQVKSGANAHDATKVESQVLFSHCWLILIHITVSSKPTKEWLTLKHYLSQGIPEMPIAKCEAFDFIRFHIIALIFKSLLNWKSN